MPGRIRLRGNALAWKRCSPGSDVAVHGPSNVGSTERIMEPQPLWNGSLPVCLVEYHQGLSRRLRLVLTWQSYLTKGERELLDHQHPVHGRIHNSGLLFGYAADRCTDPDWYVLPDGHLPDAWKLIHAARKGGDRFCVGRGARYTFRQASDTANKAKDYSFESLHKI